MSQPKMIDKASAQELLKTVEFIMLDIDGVIWAGADVIPGIPETLAYLRKAGKKIRFLSNNASLSRKQLLNNFEKKGIQNIIPQEACNSAYASALHLKELLGDKSTDGLVHGNVFVVGEQGLCDEIQQVLAPGFITYGTELHDPEGAGGYDAQTLSKSWREQTLPAPVKPLIVRDASGKELETVQAGSANARNITLGELRAVAVIGSLDFHFNMVKLAHASMILQGPPASFTELADEKPAVFIATNEDPQIPIGKDSVLMPDAGPTVGALRTVTGREPDAMCGKPNKHMAEILFNIEGITDPQTQCLMIGDRLTTDVAFGNNAGCQTMLVLSGAENLDDVKRAQEAGETVLIPTYVAPSLAVFLPE